jgi:hypothetical protein
MASPSCLVVLGPSEDYELRDIDGGLVRKGKPRGRRVYAQAFQACDPKPAGESVVANVMLRKGTTVSGRVVGPDGQPVQYAWIVSRVCLPPSVSAWRFWRPQFHGSVKSGGFEIHGLDPDAAVPVYFLDPHHKLGAPANLTDKSAADGPHGSASALRRRQGAAGRRQWQAGRRVSRPA